MFLRVFLCLVLFVLPPPAKALQTATETGNRTGSVYLVAYRTARHINYSKPDVFHGFSQDLLKFLKESGVPIKIDPDRGTIETESKMSLTSMLNIARQLGASSLLLVTIDRPLTKWIKVTVESYDLEGKQLWSEQAADGGGLTGKGGYDKTLVKIKAVLAKRLGGPGLPTDAQTAEQAKEAAEGSEP
ncbi:MAG: hypothetical protein KGN79_07420 [Acidobacteriota bacterium]|nr:hypothetical protein [Acidobacteriota bacterium]